MSAEKQQKVLTALIFVTAVALAFVIFEAEAGTRSRESDCYESCHAFDADMVLANRYGCVCRDEDGSFMFGDQGIGD